MSRALTCMYPVVLVKVGRLLERAVAEPAAVLPDVRVHKSVLGQLLPTMEPLPARAAPRPARL